jgi:hypothetical protein
LGKNLAWRVVLETSPVAAGPLFELLHGRLSTGGDLFHEYSISTYQRISLISTKDRLHIWHCSFQRVSHYFKSGPFPLEKAISDSLSKAVSRSGVRTVPISNWDREPESLKNIEADSILLIEIKRFWTEGIAAVRGTRVITSIYLVIHLGVKKEGKVFRRNVYAMKESTVARLTPAGVEQMVNQILTEILDNFFSNPY